MPGTMNDPGWCNLHGAARGVCGSAGRRSTVGTMALGLLLRGVSSLPDPDLVARVHAFARARFGGGFVTRNVDEAGRPVLYLDLHPAAEHVALAFEGHDLEIAANTSTVGPGYHAHVVDVVDTLAAAFRITWRHDAEGDVTGYFDNRDFRHLQQEMLGWLGALTNAVLPLASGTVQLALPATHTFESGGHARTPLGPRERPWFERVAESPASGRDFFAWWEKGENAEHYLGVALSLLWTTVRWRPAVSERERELRERTFGALSRARDLDPTLRFPFAEWRELLTIDGRNREADALPRADPAIPAIGYRRNPVRVSMPGGWSLRIPGNFAEELDDKGTFCGWHGGRTVWFTSFRYEGGARTAEEMWGADPDEGEGETFTTGEGAFQSRARLRRVRGGEESDCWILRTDSALPPQIAICTISFTEDHDRAWALETWRSLRHPGHPG